MLATRKNTEHPIARLLASTALIVLSASYAYWQNFATRPKTETLTSENPSSAAPKLASIPAPPAAPVPVEAPPAANAITPLVPDSAAPQRPTAVAPRAAAAEPQLSAVAPASAPQQPIPAATDTPPAAPVSTPAGTHLEDGEYVGQHEDFEWGTVQVKILIRSGAIADVQFLQIPDHRARSAELSDLAKPVLIREAIRDQKSAVDVVSSATYTSMAYQDSLADAILKATR